MFDFIDKLRKKPLAERKMIALIVSASITAIIFFVWISTFWIKPFSSDSKEKPALSGLTPLSSIKSSALDAYSNFAKFWNIGKSIKATND